MMHKPSNRKDYKMIEKYCEYCGKQLDRNYYPNCGRREDIEHFRKRKYCDRTCMRKAMVNVGVNNANDSNTHTTARRINELFLSKTQCEKCGSIENLDIHHIDHNPNNNNLDNLMCLCRSCHMKIHRPKPKCQICGEDVKGLGYCNKHYIRYKKYGNPYIVYGKDERR